MSWNGTATPSLEKWFAASVASTFHLRIKCRQQKKPYRKLRVGAIFKLAYD
jgi:hypothetical protein